jgi:hypothetical protein
MTPNLTGRIPKHVVFQRTGDETVLLNSQTGVYYGLNGVGSRIWELLAEGKNLKTICECLKAEYKVSPEALQMDALRLVQELQAKGLLEVVGR